VHRLRISQQIQANQHWQNIKSAQAGPVHLFIHYLFVGGSTVLPLTLGMLLHYLVKLKIRFSADIQQIWKKISQIVFVH